jgi:hypothetical protein
MADVIAGEVCLGKPLPSTSTCGETGNIGVTIGQLRLSTPDGSAGPELPFIAFAVSELANQGRQSGRVPIGEFLRN